MPKKGQRTHAAAFRGKSKKATLTEKKEQGAPAVIIRLFATYLDKEVPTTRQDCRTKASSKAEDLSLAHPSVDTQLG